jgi:hypothetical protein
MTTVDLDRTKSGRITWLHGVEDAGIPVAA